MKSFIHLVAFLERHGSLVLILTLFLMVASALGIHQVDINTDFTVFMPSQSAQLPLVQKMAVLFGDSNQMLFLIQTDGSPDDLVLLQGLSQDLTSISGVRSTQFPVPPGLLQSQYNREPSPEDFSQSLRLLESISGQSPLAERTDGDFWLTIRISLDEQSESPGQVIADIEARADVLNRDYLLSGEPYLQGKVYHYVQSLLIFLPPAAILLLLLVFRLRIGSTKATLLSMIPAVLGGLFTLGTISWLSGSISIISVLVPIFIIVLGSADGLHVTSHVMDRLTEGISNSRAVASTLEAVGIPIIMTSLTTMAGFLSLMLIDSPAIREMGLAAAWGIALAGLATWIVLPVFLLKMKPLKRKAASSRNLVLTCLRIIQGKPAIIITLILFGISIPGIFLVRADFSMLSMYKQNTDVRQNIETTSEILGGAIPVTLLFETDSVFDSNTAEAVTDFQQRIASSGIAQNSISLYQALSAIASMMNNRTDLPEGEAAQSMLLNAITDFHPELIDSFYSSEGYGRAFFFLPDLSNETLDGFLSTASEVSHDHGIVLKPVSTVFAMKEMNDRIIHQQFYSLVLALVLVIILSSLTQKSLKLGLLSGLPISLTLVSLFGFMGFAGLELSIVSGIMTGLTVGVGVDYAIHYISLYRYAKLRADKNNMSNPAEQALDYVASPILANAIGLAIGFSAMNLSPFRIHVILSLLMWVTMVLSAFFSLSLLPTLLGIKRSRIDQPGEV